MIGKTILHYKVLSKLGEGGMGVVYKAEDTKLMREVAIKFLPRQIAASDEERARFRIEAQAAAALNHSNIATIHNIEESEDEIFIVMEYVEGRELKEKIDGGPLPLDDALSYATQIAKGLKAAHDKDIIHRDIKSANIMLTDEGDVKIMDFGLAKQGGRTKLTQEGTTLGTVAYMSPEQTRGDEVDQRSDIFSLGVLIYEMVTGQLPFKGDYDQAVTYSILNEEPEPITGLRTGVPRELERIVNKCLEKDASDRYPRADDLIVDLRRLQKESETKEILSRADSAETEPMTGTHAPSSTSSGGRVPPQSARFKSHAYLGLAVLLVLIIAGGYYFLKRDDPIDSIAVLPFVNTNEDPDIDYLSDGLTETLINKLSQLPQLRVMARNTVFQFKGQNLTAEQVGGQLGVKAILMGQIVQRGEALRVNAELIDVSDGAQIWGDQYNRTLDDLFAIEDAISEQISTSLRLKLSRAEKSRLVTHHTENMEAYELYLKGRFFWNKRTGKDLQTALSYFEQAIEKDPEYALGYVGQADCYVLLPWYAGVQPSESYPNAKEAARKALEIDEALGEAYTALAMANVLYDWDWDSAEKNFVRAIQLSPNYPTAHHWYGLVYLNNQSRHQEAVAELQKALALDPLSLVINVDLGFVYNDDGSYDLAVEQFRKAIEMDQGFYPAYYGLGHIQIAKGEIAAGLKTLQEGMRLDDNALLVCAAGYGHGIAGDTVEAKKSLEALDELARTRYISPYMYAVIYAGLGDQEKVLEYLQAAIEDRSEFVVYLNVENHWDKFRSDPRFADLLRKIGLAE